MVVCLCLFVCLCECACVCTPVCVRARVCVCVCVSASPDGYFVVCSVALLCLSSRHSFVRSYKLHCQNIWNTNNSPH